MKNLNEYIWLFFRSILAFIMFVFIAGPHFWWMWLQDEVRFIKNRNYEQEAEMIDKLLREALNNDA